jgi:hypothetical protein
LSRDALFNEAPLSNLLFAYEKKLPQEVAELEGNRVLSSSFSDLCAYFVARYRLDVPTLKLDQVQALPPADTKIQLSPHESQFFYDEAVMSVSGSTFSIVVPFEGDPDLFKYQPRQFYMNHLEGVVQGTDLLLQHTQRDENAQAVKTEFDDRLRRIQEYLQTQRQEVSDWNAKLPQQVKTLLEERKKKALSALSVAESLGYPLKRREDMTAVPVARKRIAVQMPPATAKHYTPEPRLEMQIYEEVLQAVSSLSVMMERSPSAFASMSEEHLRDHILVILNTQFEGQATGETFNKQGKTDILIREKDRNVFIAECKFWDGPKTLTGAIDQLLSYACWRDTKLAVIVFNRRKDFSAVLAAIPETVTGHTQCARRLDYKAESGFRFVFKQKDDPNREMTLTVLAFDVPGTDTEEAGSPAPALPAASRPRPSRPRSKR